jgi:pSer/pThr/pTyr-binding forkhead associated (FHA) protein
MAATNRVLTLEVYRGQTLLHTAEFSQESITIGSGKAALLSIADKSVADLHAVINVDETGSLYVLDLGSPGGTHVNGEPVSNQEIHNGDYVEMGDVRVVVFTGLSPEDDESTLVEQQDLSSGRPAFEPDYPEDGVTPPTEAHRFVAPISQTTPTPPPAAAQPSEPEAIAPEDQTEDVMQFIMRSGTARTTMGIDRKRPKVLEVNQIWEEVLLDTRHFPRRGRPVTVGSSVGWRWRFLGVDMGWVRAPLHTLLRYTPPMWSEVEADWRNDFYAPDDNFAGPDHKLFEWDGDHYIARIRESWDGFVDIGTERHSFDDMLHSGKAEREDGHILVPITDDSRIMVDVGGVVFFSHMVHPGRRVLARMSEQVDYPFIAIFSLVGFIGLMFGILMYTLPPPPKNELVEIPDRFTKLLIERPDIPQEQKKPGGNPDAGEGEKAKREEGKVGKKDAEMEKAKGNKVEIEKQQRDREIAESAGVLGANLEGSELEGVWGSSVVDASLTGGIGGVTGAKGVQRGSGGLGSRGSGLGGGGSAEGLGGLGTKGSGSGRSGFGAGGGDFGAKGEGGIGMVGGDPIILGALDRALIDEVIKRHMSQIRYCYQRELTKDPTLSGKIVIKFVISRDGSVSSASVKTTTMNNNAVQSCVVGRFMRMQFPQPKGGGIVIVSYPFLFSPA